MTPWAAAATAGGGPRLRVVHVGKGAGARDVAAGGAEQRQAARGRRVWLAGPVYDAGETGAMPASPTASRSCPRTRDRGPATADAHSGARGGILLITRTNDSSAVDGARGIDYGMDTAEPVVGGDAQRIEAAAISK